MRVTSALFAFAVLSVATSAWARPFRVGDLPNGSQNGCLNCHGDMKGGTRTEFGSDAQDYLGGAGGVQQQHVDWAPLCPLDSDGDGWTNGRELGDPDCKWKVGDPDPAATVFNPGNEYSHPFPVCGNGKLDADEICEGDMLSVTACAEKDAGEGVLACDAKCHFDYSGCSSPPGSSMTGGGELPPPATEEEGCSAAGAGAPGGSAAAVTLVLGLALARAAARRRPARRGRVGERQE